MKMQLSMSLDFESLNVDQLDRLIQYATWARDDKKREIAALLKSGNLESVLRAKIASEGKLAAIKLCRDLTGKGLVDSKNLVDSL
jgi:ribosomal protein L7/L12